MKVILRKNFEQLGKIGDIANVKDGYARNFLIPKGIVFKATDGALRSLENEKKQKENKNSRLLLASQTIADKLKRAVVIIKVKVGEEDKLFGSVTASDIAENLYLQKIEIDKKSIELDEPIKSLGTHNVSVKLHNEVKGNIKVIVNKE